MLDRHRVPYQLHTYQVAPDTPDYGRAVAEALGVPATAVFKTLLATATRDSDELVVAVVPVAGELDLKALAAAVAAKRCAVAERAAAERATGYVRGGISPLGQRRTLPTVLDASAAGLESIYVSAGRRGLQVALAPEDLTRLTGARIAAIARDQR